MARLRPVAAETTPQRHRDDGSRPVGLSFIATLNVGAWVAGRIVWSRQQMVDQLSAQAVELERGRAAEARLAAAEERARIARELHDVVAHSVSVMVVQAEAAEALLPDSERSGQALHAIQDTGRSTLAELRHLLGALDDGSTPDTIARQPSPRLGDADRLVEHLRAAGLDVSLRVEGQHIAIPSGVDLAAYRVLQEALTNALRHAGRTSVEATVRITNDEVMVDVIDRARPHLRLISSRPPTLVGAWPACGSGSRSSPARSSPDRLVRLPGASPHPSSGSGVSTR